MAKRSFTYRFWVSATNEGYDRSQKIKPPHLPDEITYTLHKKLEDIAECDNGKFVINKEDIHIRKSIPLKNSKDVLRYQLQKIVRHYLHYCGVDEQNTCIIEYELLRENKFSKNNEFISDELRDEVGFMVNAIKAIGDNTLICPNEQIKAMHFEIPLNYVSSEIFYILNVRKTSDSPELARKYLKDFITAFFCLIPKDVIEKYDTLYEKREKVRLKNTARDKESCEIICSISPNNSKTNDGKAFALVSRLIKKDLILEIGHIIYSVYKEQSFCFESFAHWKKAIIAFLNIDGKSIKYEDSNTPSAILKEISNERHINDVEKFLYYIEKYYIMERKIKKGVELSAIFYKFLNLCPSKYLNAKYKRRVGNVDKEFKRAEFKNLCLQYFGLAPNQYKPKDLVKVSNIEFNSYVDNENVWDRIK